MNQRDQTRPVADGDEPAKSNVGTIAGVVAIVGAGLTTVLSAITDFGADNGALDAARRNHTGWLVVSVGFAASGLILGAIYAVLREAPDGSRRARSAPWFLVLGVFAVGAGVVGGVTATANRDTGHPTIAVSRAGEDGVKISVTADGLPSNTKYEARVEGYYQLPGQEGIQTFVDNLTSARFSPRQDGRLEWSHVVDISPANARPINYVLVIVAKQDVGELVCSEASPDTKGATATAPTCLYTRLPPFAGAATTTPSTP